MNIAEIKSDIIKDCKDLDGLLDSLTDDKVREIAATDCNWCVDWNNSEYCGSFDSEEEAVSRALYSSYAVIVGEI